MWEPNEAVIADLVRGNAQRRGDLDVLTFEHLSVDGGATADEVRTYADLAERGNRLASVLVRDGVEVGERVAIMMRNHPEFVEAMVAASITGTVLVPIDPRTKGEKLAFLLRDAACRGVICGDESLEAIDAARLQAPEVSWVLALETGACDLSSFADVRPLAEAFYDPMPTVDVRLPSTSHPLQIIYTSGTTGDPKGVVFPNDRFGGFAMLGHLVGYQPDDRPYTGLSFTHGNAQAVTLGPSLGMGLRGVFSRRFTKSRLWDVCRAHGATTFSLLGGMATAIYSESRRPDDSDNPVRFVASAGMPAAIWTDFEQRFGVRVFEWYGAIEGGLACNPVGAGPVGSFGKPVGGLEMKILDEHDNECSPFVVGQICSRPAGGAAHVEYHGKPEASESKTLGGWLRSGDMGHTDSDGWFYFDHREGGGIRHNGDFVSTGFVEKVIADEPSVSDVFVYGVPAASGAPGEKDVVAAVVAHPGGTVDVAAVFAACRANLEANFVPGYVQVVEEIPKTISEKPIERFLVDKFDPADVAVFAFAS